jgi:hypothetical protein
MYKVERPPPLLEGVGTGTEEEVGFFEELEAGLGAPLEAALDVWLCSLELGVLGAADPELEEEEEEDDGAEEALEEAEELLERAEEDDGLLLEGTEDEDVHFSPSLHSHPLVPETGTYFSSHSVHSLAVHLRQPSPHF